MLRNIVAAKNPVHTMFMASGDPLHAALFTHETAENAARRLIPHLHGMFWRAGLGHLHLTSAATTLRSVASPHEQET